MASRTLYRTHVETNPPQHYTKHDITTRPSQEGRLRPTLPGTASRVDAWEETRKWAWALGLKVEGSGFNFRELKGLVSCKALEGFNLVFLLLHIRFCVRNVSMASVQQPKP